MMSTLTAALIVAVGMATAYTAEHADRPLYCDRGNGLTYGNTVTPWVALDVSEYRSGRVQCGDRIEVTFENGEVLVAYALDAGPLYPYQIAEAGYAPIIVDVPAHLAPFEGLSARCRLVNLSGAGRMMVAPETEGAP
jgi:hypothetical protein